MKHVNIPVFIPHLGFPNQCIFCNQRYISGTTNFNEEQVDEIINSVLSTVDGTTECEIAFFGGSFTGIDRALMIRLLEKAQGYVDNGQAVGIRLSTRPDYINEEIISVLKRYTITCVELGIQSMNDRILADLKRGHTVLDTYNATKLLKENNISFGGQMMIGLPGATIEDEIFCAKEICKMGAIGTRIYPTLVFKNTELEEITRKGVYKPLSLEEAIERSARVYKVFCDNNVQCYRIGLCESDNLHSADAYFAGPNSASIGEMVKSRVYFNEACNLIVKNCLEKAESLIIECPNGRISQIIGNKKANIEELKKQFGFKYIKVVENSNLQDFQIIIYEKEESQCV
jgi:histone acetyltransferase (RNA polymerase elongator complex component)